MLFGLLFALVLPAAAAEPPSVRVRIETSAGNIVVAVDTKRAPVTALNFLAYVDDGRFDGTSFYRAGRRKEAPKLGIIQGGISTDARRTLAPIAHEPTTRTGLSHIDGSISMARPNRLGSTMGNFFICVGANRSMDARGDNPGYAVFGKVVSGMDVARRILALPTGGGSGAMKGQMILKPVRILRAVRMDGTPRPTGKVKAWQMGGR